MDYFTFEEFLKSETAEARNIKNIPTWQHIKNLERLKNALNGIREAFGSPLNISSGYRCEALNKAVGGAKTSAHTTGNAADLQPQRGTAGDLYRCMVKYLNDNHLKYDELFIENGSWVHFALYSSGGRQRMKNGTLKA